MGKNINLVLVFVLAIYFYGGCIFAIDEIDFTLEYSIPESTENYINFIKELRKALTIKTGSVSVGKKNISLLANVAPGKGGFILVHLTNKDYATATIAIDKTNVYVVASSDGTNSFFFTDAPKEARDQLFKGTKSKNLTYSSNYIHLEKAAKVERDSLPLGLDIINSEIYNLAYLNKRTEPPAKSFLVLIQTIAEAARFSYIEDQVTKHASSNFTPKGKIITLENNWSSLSEQIQIAVKNKGQFKTPITLKDDNYKQFNVTDINSDVVQNDIELLLYVKTKLLSDDDNSEAVAEITNRKSLGNYKEKLNGGLTAMAEVLVAAM